MSLWWQQFHFLRPEWLLAIVPSLAVWWLLRRESDPRYGLADDIAPHLLENLVSQPSDRPRWRPSVVLPPMALLTILALAGPSGSRQPSPFAEDKAHLYLVVRMTPSMMTEDLLPSRLERTRTKLSELLSFREGAATGLIVYAGSAHLVMPATSDAEVLDHMMQSVSPEIMPTEGDVLAEALSLASRQIERERVGGSILVVADAVDASQRDPLARWRSTSPYQVQFSVPLRDETALQASGIPDALVTLGAKGETFTPDDRDVQLIASRAERALVAGDSDASERWRDDGYVLVPLVALGLLLWSRRGWSLGRG